MTRECMIRDGFFIDPFSDGLSQETCLGALIGTEAKKRKLYRGREKTH